MAAAEYGAAHKKAPPLLAFASKCYLRTKAKGGRSGTVRGQPGRKNHKRQRRVAGRNRNDGKTANAPDPRKHVRTIGGYWRSASRCCGSVSLTGRLVQPAEIDACAVR